MVASNIALENNSKKLSFVSPLAQLQNFEEGAICSHRVPTIVCGTPGAPSPSPSSPPQHALPHGSVPTFPRAAVCVFKALSPQRQQPKHCWGVGGTGPW